LVRRVRIIRMAGVADHAVQGSTQSEPQNRSSVNVPPMPDPYNHDHHSFPIDTINHPIVSHANPEMVRLCFELLVSWRKRIFAERGNLLCDPALKLLVEILELADGGRREFKNIPHGR